MYEENLATINAATTVTDHITQLWRINAATPPADHIRLLRPSRMKPRLWRLKVFSLHKAPPFAALSYSWGDREADGHIKLDTGSTIVEYPNFKDLSCAIARLSKMGVTWKEKKTEGLFNKTKKLCWLWIDAICIDQASNSEKNDQVAMMSSIYKAAYLVYVWLGEEIAYGDARADMPFDALSDHMLGAGICTAKTQELISQGTHVWWQRLWVIQEVVSCEDVRVCIGHYCTPWHSFWSLLEKHLHRDYDIIATEGSTTNKVEAAIEQITDIVHLRSQLRQSVDGFSIFALLRMTSAGVSNPVDRIYSLLGVASSRDWLRIPIDYGSSLMRVFLTVVRYAIETQGHLGILFNGWRRGNGLIRHEANQMRIVDQSTGTMTNRSKDHDDGLPTWLPNFMEPLSRGLWGWLSLNASSASLDTRAQATVRDETLVLEALYLDVVRTTSHSFTHVAVDLEDRDRNSLDEPRNKLVPPETIDHVARLIGPELYRPAGLIYFGTNLGFTGVSWEHVKEGDEVIVPFGSKPPVIIRSMESSPPIYTLVSECFVGGIMMGELMTLHREAEIESQTYTIV